MLIKRIKQENIIISAIISIFCVYGLSKEYVIGANPLVKTNSVFAFLLWILLSCMFYFLNLKIQVQLLTLLNLLMRHSKYFRKSTY